MIFRISSNVYIRHAGDESLLWNRRTSACVILKDAKPFLDAVSYELRSEDEIICKVAKTFECKSDEVAEDVRKFLSRDLAIARERKFPVQIHTGKKTTRPKIRFPGICHTAGNFRRSNSISPTASRQRKFPPQSTKTTMFMWTVPIVQPMS